MMTKGRARLVWGLGLLVYLVGGILCLLTPFLLPFVGAVVLLACASATGTPAKDDRFVMAAAVTEGVIGAFLSFMTFEKPPAWLEPIAVGSYLVGIVLPLVVIGYRLVKP